MSLVFTVVTNKSLLQVSQLEAEIQKLNLDQLLLLKDNIHTLFYQCVQTLSHGHHIRVVYALQVL